MHARKRKKVHVSR